jgi:hypothetical protein
MVGIALFPSSKFKPGADDANQMALARTQPRSAAPVMQRTASRPEAFMRTRIATSVTETSVFELLGCPRQAADTRLKLTTDR